MTRGLPVRRPALWAPAGRTIRPPLASTWRQRKPAISPRRAPVMAMTRMASATVGLNLRSVSSGRERLDAAHVGRRLEHHLTLAVASEIRHLLAGLRSIRRSDTCPGKRRSQQAGKA